MSIFKDFKIDIIVNFIYKYKVNFLTPLLLTFADLLADVYHAIWCNV